MRWIVALLLALAAPAHADVAEAVHGPVLARLEGFVAATAALDAAAEADCRPDALRPAFNDAFDAWLGISFLNMGPMEEDGMGLAIAFWPDPKGMGQKALNGLVSKGDLGALLPDVFSEQSVAARGLFALEKLLYSEPRDDFRCALTRAVAADLSRMAQRIAKGWREDYGPALLTAGDPGNRRFLTADEAKQALFTMLLAGLEFDADNRLGRPLGTFDRPRPERAEARASARSQRNVALSLMALRDLAVALAPDSPETQAAFDRAIALAGALDDPVFAGVEDPTGRLKVEIVQQAVRLTRDAAQVEIGTELGVGTGFNSADGD